MRSKPSSRQKNGGNALNRRIGRPKKECRKKTKTKPEEGRGGGGGGVGGRESRKS